MVALVIPKVGEIIPANRINPRIMLLYSQPKEGKTTLLSTLPKSLLIDVEDGSDFISATKIKVSNLTELNKVGGDIIKQGKPFDYIILDTASELESWAEQDATERYRDNILGKNWKGNSVLELPKGAGYYWLRMSYGLYFNALAKVPAKCLIVLAHVRDKMIVDKKGREVNASDVDLTGKLKQITCSKADAIGYLFRKTIGADNGKPVQDMVISFLSGDVNSGSRMRRLAGKEITISRVEFDETKPIVADWSKIFVEEKNERTST